MHLGELSEVSTSSGFVETGRMNVGDGLKSGTIQSSLERTGEPRGAHTPAVGCTTSGTHFGFYMAMDFGFEVLANISFCLILYSLFAAFRLEVVLCNLLFSAESDAYHPLSLFYVRSHL